MPIKKLRTCIIDNDLVMRARYEAWLRPYSHVTFFHHPRQLLIELGRHLRPHVIISETFFGDQKDDDFRRWVKDFSSIPLIIATKHCCIDLMRDMYQLGARDYLIKPFVENELVAKWERSIHRPSTLARTPQIDMEGTPFKIQNLTPKESQLLTLFMQAKDHRVSKYTMSEQLWSNVLVHHKAINVHLHNLRKKIKNKGYDINHDGSGNWVLETRN